MKNFWIACLFVSACAYAQSPNNTPQTGGEQQALVGPATPQTKIDVAKQADIRRLMEVAGTKELMNKMIQSMSTSLKPVMTQMLPAGSYRENLINLFFIKFQAKANIQDLQDSIVPIYDKYLSDDEIKELIQFYQTPLGQKTVRVMPQLLTESEQAGQKWGENLGRQSMMEVLAEHPEFEKAIEESKKPGPAQ